MVRMSGSIPPNEGLDKTVELFYSRAMKTQSYKPEVIADSSGEWCSNGLRFATEAEAKQYVADLANRWLAVRETRVVPCNDPVTHEIVDGVMRSVDG